MGEERQAVNMQQGKVVGGLLVGTRSGGQIMRQLPPASIDATRTVCSLLRAPLPFSSSFTEVYYVML